MVFFFITEQQQQQLRPTNVCKMVSIDLWECMNECMNGGQDYLWISRRKKSLTVKENKRERIKENMRKICLQ